MMKLKKAALFIVGTILMMSQAFALPQLFNGPEIPADSFHPIMQKNCDKFISEKSYLVLNDYLKQNDNVEATKDKNGWYLANVCLLGVVSMDRPRYELIEDWIKKFPQNPYAHLAKTSYLLNEYYILRGNKYISQMPKEQFIKANEKLEEAARYADSVKSISNTPLWYQYRINIAFRQQDRNNFFNITKESLNKYPNFLPLYTTASSQMLPEWGFSYDMLEDFAKFSVVNSNLKEEAYAVIYNGIVTPCCSHKIISANFFDLKTFQKGVEIRLKKYPTQFNFNDYANTACLLKDKKTAKDIIENKLVIYMAVFWTANYEECLEFIK